MRACGSAKWPSVRFGSGGCGVNSNASVPRGATGPGLLESIMNTEPSSSGAKAGKGRR